MLQPKDLKVGNYVGATIAGEIHGSLATYQIKDGKDIDNAKWYFPIELTEDWLKKFGFYEGAEHYYINASNKRVRPLKILVKISESGFYISLWDESEEIVIFEGKKYYVHKLQNLYSAHKEEELILIK